jgi:hypothetical protein
MNSFLAKIGLITIVLLLLYIIKKISDYFYFKKDNYQENDKVYKAAREFAQGAPFDDISGLLANCIDFDEEDTEEVLSRSFPHRTDEDGGYNAFIKAVNKVLGGDVYRELSN